MQTSLMGARGRWGGQGTLVGTSKGLGATNQRLRSRQLGGGAQ